MRLVSYLFEVRSKSRTQAAEIAKLTDSTTKLEQKVVELQGEVEDARLLGRKEANSLRQHIERISEEFKTYAALVLLSRLFEPRTNFYAVP